jgi:hypothetical protein
VNDPSSLSSQIQGSEIKVARSYAYTPSDAKRKGQQEEFQYPKPVIADMTLEKARHLSSRKIPTPYGPVL